MSEDKLDQDTIVTLVYETWEYCHGFFWKQWTHWALWIIFLNAVPWINYLNSDVPHDIRLGPAVFALLLTPIASVHLIMEYDYLSQSGERLRELIGNKNMPDRDRIKWLPKRVRTIRIGLTMIGLFAAALLVISLANVVALIVT